MEKDEYTFVSANGKSTIYVKEWQPDEVPIAVIQIAHGVTEHIGRYEELACFLVSKGFVVVGNDHLGHGKSISNDETKMCFGGEGSWKYAAKDVAKLAEMTMAKYPKLPYFILGFSLGSFLVRTVLIDRPDIKFSGAIIAGTGQQSWIATALGKTLASSEAKKYGDASYTKKVDELTFGSYNKHFEPNQTKADWLCANKPELDAYLADPMVGKGFTAGLFRELLYGMAYTGSLRKMKKMDKNIPILFISGEDDPVGDFTNGVHKAAEAFKSVKVNDITERYYPGMRHDIFHEANSIQVFNEMNTWMRNYLFG